MAGFPISGRLTTEQIKYLDSIDQQNKSDRLKLNQNMGRDQFLNILMTQLANQNPLDPLKDKDFIAQMAQFSSVESMQALTETFEKVQGDIAIIKEQMANNTTSSDLSAQKQLLEEINNSIKDLSESQILKLNEMISAFKTQQAYE